MASTTSSAWGRGCVEQCLGGEQHARRAIAALGGEVLHERLLQRVQAGAVGEAGRS